MELARTFGATHTVNTALLKDGLIKEIRNITGGTGTTITVDATGVVSLIQEGLEATANQGKMILLGVAPMDAGLEISLVRYMFVSLPSYRFIALSHSRSSLLISHQTGKSILGSMEGSVMPEEVS